MTRRDWAGRWGPTLDGLIAGFALLGAVLMVIGGR